jgi:hypothetical protein
MYKVGGAVYYVMLWYVTFGACRQAELERLVRIFKSDVDEDEGLTF